MEGEGWSHTYTYTYTYTEIVSLFGEIYCEEKMFNIIKLNMTQINKLIIVGRTSTLRRYLITCYVEYTYVCLSGLSLFAHS